MGIGIGNHIALHHHVLHDEIRPVKTISHDATHESGSQHHRVGLLLVKETLHGHLVRKIQFTMRAAHQVVVSPGHQVVPDGGTHQAMVSRHVYLTVLVQHAVYTLIILIS